MFCENPKLTDGLVRFFLATMVNRKWPKNFFLARPPRKKQPVLWSYRLVDFHAGYKYMGWSSSGVYSLFWMASHMQNFHLGDAQNKFSNECVGVVYCSQQELSSIN